MQRSSTLPGTSKITACPLSSTIVGDPIIRPVVTPSDQNGLRRVSQVEVDWIFTEGAERFGARMGSLEAAMLTQVDEALARWLDL